MGKGLLFGRLPGIEVFGLCCWVRGILVLGRVWVRLNGILLGGRRDLLLISLVEYLCRVLTLIHHARVAELFDETFFALCKDEVSISLNR